jgi:uncharacterized protein
MREATQVLDDFMRFPLPMAGTTSFLQLDGYLTAVGVGPGFVSPSDWIADMWPEEPVFNDLEKTRQLIAALLNHYDGIIRQLNGPAEHYRPLYLPVNPAQPATVERASEWSQGFWNAMTRDPGWQRLIDDKDARYLLAPILVFAKDSAGKALFTRTHEQLDGLLKDSADTVAECILLIQDYFRKYAFPSDRHGGSLRLGRNDPCPCGSGKKYKRCCGAN